MLPEVNQRLHEIQDVRDILGYMSCDLSCQGCCGLNLCELRLNALSFIIGNCRK